MLVILRWVSQVVLVVKNPLASAGDIRVQSLGQEDPLEGMATHSSIISWRMSWTEESRGLQSMGVTQSQT